MYLYACLPAESIIIPSSCADLSVKACATRSAEYSLALESSGIRIRLPITGMKDTSMGQKA